MRTGNRHRDGGKVVPSPRRLLPRGCGGPAVLLGSEGPTQIYHPPTPLLRRQFKWRCDRSGSLPNSEVWSVRGLRVIQRMRNRTARKWTIRGGRSKQGGVGHACAKAGLVAKGACAGGSRGTWLGLVWGAVRVRSGRERGGGGLAQCACAFGRGALGTAISCSSGRRLRSALLRGPAEYWATTSAWN